MAKHDDMMILPLDTRRDYFRKAYALELGRLHATGRCAWPIENLPVMVGRVMAGILDGNAPAGPAFDATMAFFGLRSQKALFAFLESGDPLAKAREARLNDALAKEYRFEGKVMSLRAILESRGDTLECRETDGMIDWSRSKFNRMNGREQSAYEAALKARRYYFVNSIKVPKIVFDWARQRDMVTA